jgi:hypothetical protein
MEDTPRKYLTALQKLKLFESQKGLCGLCGRKIFPGEKTIVEHMRALALGGTNDIANLCVAHEACAANKTSKEDIPRIRKSKAAKAHTFGFKNDGGRKLAGRGFPAVSAGKRSVCDPSLKVMPRRPMFTEMGDE